MSSRFDFRLAGEAEDSALRAVLRESTMPGSVSLSFCREPSFFLAEQAGNVSHQTMICEDRQTGKIVGIAGRSVRKSYIDGVKKNVGYLSSLRVTAEARSGMTLVRGSKHIHKLHLDGKVPYYVTTILDENKYAQQILESGRVGMPVYIPIGMFVTYLIPIKNKVSFKLKKQVIPCDASTLASAHKCLNQWNSRYQFAPVYTLDDIAGETNLLPNFFPKDMYVSMDEGRVVGTLGVWNQQSFKQTVVTNYSALVRKVKPFYNGVAKALGRPTLPEIGESFKFVCASFVSAEDDNPKVFEALINKARSDWSGLGHDYLVVGLSEENKLSSVAHRLAERELRSKVYLVHWPNDMLVLPERLRVIHLEVSTL